MLGIILEAVLTTWVEDPSLYYKNTKGPETKRRPSNTELSWEENIQVMFSVTQTNNKLTVSLISKLIP